MRWRDKNGIQDLEKARHFLDKYLEVERAKLESIVPDTDEPTLRVVQDGHGFGHVEPIEEEKGS